MNARFFKETTTSKVNAVEVVYFCVGKPLRVYHYNKETVSIDIFGHSSSQSGHIEYSAQSFRDKFKEKTTLLCFETHRDAVLYGEHLHQSLQNKGLESADFSPVIYRISVHPQSLLNAQRSIVEINNNNLKLVKVTNSSQVHLIEACLSMVGTKINLQEDAGQNKQPCRLM